MFAVAVWLSSLTSLPDVVCSARFFKAGNEKSYYHLYMCRLDGAKLRQLTFGKKLQVAPYWINHENLAYVELERPPYSDGSRTGIHHQARINVLNLRTNRTKTLIEMNGTDIYAEYDPNLNAMHVGSGIFKISLDGVKRLAPKREPVPYVDPWTEVSEGVYSAFLPSLTAKPHFKVTRKEASSLYKAITSSETYNDVDITIETELELGTYRVHGSSIEQLESKGNQKLLLVTTVSPNRLDQDSFVYDIDTKNRKCKLILNKIGTLHIISGSGLWIGRQLEARPLVQIPNSGVEWANFLFAGDLNTGKRWTLFNGLVDASHYSIRPSKLQLKKG